MKACSTCGTELKACCLVACDREYNRGFNAGLRAAMEMVQQHAQLAIKAVDDEVHASDPEKS